MIKYQLPHTRFDQISYHKHDIYLYGKLYTMFAFFLSMVSEVIVRKNSKQTFPQVGKVTVQKLVTGFWAIASNHKVSKYWASTDLLFLIKNSLECFQPRRFVVDLFRICSLHIINRNHSNTFLLINLQKAKTCPKVNHFSNPANIYLFEVNNRNSRKRFEIFSKLTIKTPARRNISLLFLVFLLLTLDK